MINVSFIYKDNEIVGVNVVDHGDPIVCSAVSILMLNCANSIEEFTNAGFKVELDPTGGNMSLEVTEFDDKGRAKLLLDSLVLGLRSVAESYDAEIRINY
jgi:hypothetical protein